jgi:hypothetical protein
MTTWRDVHHQAERCRRLHVREQQLPAAKLLFELLREQLSAWHPDKAPTSGMRFVRPTGDQQAAAR